MKVFKYIKRLNNTDLRKKKTKDNYVSFYTSYFNPNIIFSNKIMGSNKRDTNKGFEIEFINKRDGNSVIVGFFEERNRIHKLGDFFRSNFLDTGDEVLFERRLIEKDNQYFEEFYIDYFRNNYDVVVMKKQNYFDCLKGDEINYLNNLTYEGKSIKVNKNNQFYNVLIDDKNFLNYCKDNNIIFIGFEINYPINKANLEVIDKRVNFNLDSFKLKNRVVLKVMSEGFICLKGDEINYLMDKTTISGEKITIKKEDSHWDILLDNESIVGEYNKDMMIGFKINDDVEVIPMDAGITYEMEV